MYLIKFIFLMGLLFSATAHAFVLPAEMVLEFMAQRLGDARSLSVKQRVVLYRGGGENDTIEMSEKLIYRFNSAFRSRIRFGSTERLLVVNSGKSVVVLNGKIQAVSENRFDRYKDLMFYRGSDLLRDKLENYKIDTSVSSLGRLGDKIVYVIGARYPDKSVPQVWIDKATFQPCRWIMSQGGNSGILDVYYENWQQNRKLWYPGSIKFYYNSALVREIFVEEFNVDAEIDPGIFDIQSLKLKYSPAAVKEKPPEGSQALDEIQTTIQKFKRLYE